MLKKLFIILFLLMIPIYSFSYEVDDEYFDINELEVSNNTSNIPNINSKHAIVIEKNTNTILFEKSSYTKTAMASTTKIMTAIIALENSNLSDLVKISKKAATTGGSTLGISSDTSLSMETLLYGLLLRSGNDCAVAIAEYISGSTENFAILMNKKAKDLNLKNTNFVTPHGLDSDNHYTTAYDLAILTKYALTNKTFSKIVNTKNCSINLNNYSKQINNTHELLGYTDGVYGVKTGFTGNAGRCLVTACKRKDLDIIIVILGADTKKIRTQDTLNLINYVYSNFEMINTYNYIEKKFQNIDYKPILLKSFTNFNMELKQNNTYIFPLNKNSQNITISPYILTTIKAPLKKNSKIGTIKFLVDNKVLYENDIIVTENIQKSTWLEYYIYSLKKYKTYFYCVYY